MEKVDLKSESVAYFADSRVPEPGFYTLKGARETSTVAVHEAVWDTEEQDVLDDDGTPTGEIVIVARTGPRGPIAKSIKKVKEIEVEHETNMEPDKRVYASPDGKGFVFDAPEEGGDFVG